MNDLNEILVEGKLVKDPQITWPQPTMAICKFTIAVNRHFIDRSTKQWVDEVSYILVETWRSVAEQCARHLKKGRGVRVVGRIKQSLWKDDSNQGKIRERIYIVAEHVEFQPQKNTAPSIIKPIAPEDDNVDTVEANKALDQQAISEESEQEYHDEIKEDEVTEQEESSEETVV